jgi:hypothetical protein
MARLSVGVLVAQVKRAVTGTGGSDLHVEARAAFVDVFNAPQSHRAVEAVDNKIGC